MERLFNFVFTYRAFFTFLLLELICFWLIVKNNQYQSTEYFNSSNRVAANIISTSQSIREYFSLSDINVTLAGENAALRKKLERQERLTYLLDTKTLKDTTNISPYDYISAKVVNNSTRNYKNFITIDKGRVDGLLPGMAVISAEGIVGKVKTVSKHYSVLISMLNIDEQVSSIIKRTGHFGTIQWDGTDPSFINLKYIPRHVKPLAGDTIVTSGYNAIFPPGTLIGVIKEVKLRDESLFYDLKVELAQDFAKLSFVEVVKSNLKAESDSLERVTIGDPK